MQPGCPTIRSEVLILTENETEKDRWLATLDELQKAAKQGPNVMVSEGNVPGHNVMVREGVMYRATTSWLERG